MGSAALICLVAGGLQVSRHAYRTNLAEHPDEAAHFVSGLCVLDYFRDAPGTNPVRFAEMYYARYPKVALGHWPPLFYVIQAAWYALVGESAAHAILLAGIAAALTALMLFLRLEKLYGVVIALAAAVVFLWLPLSRFSELTLMADMPAVLFQLLAVWALCDACLAPRRRHWLIFAMWTLLAVLTKESALTLLLVAPVALLFLHGRDMARSSHWRRGVAAAGMFLLLAALTYAAGGVRMRQAWSNVPNLAFFFTSASPIMLAISGYGIAGFVRRQRTAAREAHVRVALVWLAVILSSQLFFRDAFEPRYLLPAYLPATLLFAAGLSRICEDLGGRLGKPAWAMTGMALCILSTPAPVIRQRTGYDAVAAAIPREDGGPVVLVSADELGEGAMTAELLLDDPTRSGVVVRATKALSSSDWLGRDYRLLVTSAESMRQLLDSTAVHFIVLDMHGFTREATRQHHRLLEETLRTYPGQFHLMSEFPLYVDGHRRDRAVQVYENLAARGRHIQSMHIDMTRMLGRQLEVKLSTPLAPGRRSQGAPRIAPPRGDVPATDFRIAPQSDSLPARGGMGRIYVTAPPGFSWSFTNVPDWIRIEGGNGLGDGVVRYEVAANQSNLRRNAAFSVGSRTFHVTQPRSAVTYAPYVENFREPLAVLWLLQPPDPNSLLDPPTQWALEDESGQDARTTITGEGLVLEKPGQTDGWKTRVSLSRITLSAAKQYRASLRIKAENPGLVWLTLIQYTAPTSSCGLATAVRVSAMWSDVAVTFRPHEGPCSEGDTRFSVEAGKISGPLTIAQFRLNEAP